MINFEPKFSKFFPYKTDKEKDAQLKDAQLKEAQLKQAQLKEAVTEVVRIYQPFLTAKVHSAESIESLQKRGFFWANESRRGPFPSCYEVKHFCAILNRALILKVKETGSASLSTNYCPGDLLKDCLIEAGITYEKYPNFHCLYPYKSCTSVGVFFDRATCSLGYSLRVNFRIPAL